MKWEVVELELIGIQAVREFVGEKLRLTPRPVYVVLGASDWIVTTGPIEHYSWVTLVGEFDFRVNVKHLHEEIEFGAHKLYADYFKRKRIA